jgi:hypothetical protein
VCISSGIRRAKLIFKAEKKKQRARILTAIRWALLSFLSLLPLAAHAESGCIWDPRGDMATCLQHMIDLLPGTPLTIPSGHWHLGHPLKLAAGTTLIGAPGVTLAPTPDNTSNPVLIQVIHAKSVHVSNLTFLGKGGGDAGGLVNRSPAIEVSNSTDITFLHVVVADVQGIGMLIEGGTSRSGVTDSVFRNIGNRWKQTHQRKDRNQGLVFCCGNNNKDNYSIGNQFFDIGLDALQISNQVGFRAVQNRFELENGERNILSSPDYPAAIFAPDSSGAVITGNDILGAQGNGIDAPGLETSTVSANQISNSGGAGIGLFVSYDGKRPPQNVTVTANHLDNNALWSGAQGHGGIVVVHRDGNVVKLLNNQVN